MQQLIPHSGDWDPSASAQVSFSRTLKLLHSPGWNHWGSEERYKDKKQNSCWITGNRGTFLCLQLCLGIVSTVAALVSADWTHVVLFRPCWHVHNGCQHQGPGAQDPGWKRSQEPSRRSGPWKIDVDYVVVPSKWWTSTPETEVWRLD